MTAQDFNNYYKENYNILLNFSKRFTNDINECEELVQVAFVKAYKGRHSFKKGSSFKSWILTILRNTFITKYNKRKRRGEVNAPVEDLIHISSRKEKTNNKGEAVINTDLIYSVVHKLSEKSRKPFMLFIEGYKYDEIAEILNVPLGTVKSRISFARKKLKESPVLLELRA